MKNTHKVTVKLKEKKQVAELYDATLSEMIVCLYARTNYV